MRAVVIGGSGHVGTYLVPRLVQQGFEVVSVSRGENGPYTPNGAWAYVEKVKLDRTAEEKSGTFGKKIAALNGDIVVDMISFKLDSAKHLVEAIRGKVSHYLYTSSIWAHGSAAIVPAPESQPRHPQEQRAWRELPCGFTVCHDLEGFCGSDVLVVRQRTAYDVSALERVV